MKISKLHVHKGMSLKDAIRAAETLGVQIKLRNGTDDICFIFQERQLMVGWHKGCPPILVSKLRQAYHRIIAA